MQGRTTGGRSPVFRAAERQWTRCATAALAGVLALAAATGHVASPAAAAPVAPGGLDRTFGTSGFVVSDVAARSALGSPTTGIVRLPDGRLVVGGSSDALPAAARYLPDGRLDPSFGQGGRATVPVAGWFRSLDVAVAPSGRVLLSGYDDAGFVVAALTAAGRPDTGFGANGVVRGSALATATAVAVQADERVVVVGTAGAWTQPRARVARLLANGAPDASFGPGGVALLDSLGDAELWDVALLADGRVVAAGSVGPREARDSLAVRLGPGGTLDAGFGAGGAARVALPGDETARALAVDAPGRYVMALAGSQAARVVRLAGDGTLDPSFGIGGVTSSVLADVFALDVLAPPDGSVLVGGGSAGGNEAVFARLNPAGFADLGFACGGKAWLALGRFDSNVTGVVLEPDGRVSFSATRSSAFEAESPDWVVGRLAVASPVGAGYRLLSAAGTTEAFGDAAPCSSGEPVGRNGTPVGVASAQGVLGQWVAYSDGGVYAFAGAGFFGSMGGTPLRRPVVGIAPARFSDGYWLVASDGGVFAFGGARFLGSMGGTPLQRPVVGMARTPSGNGYWLVASDGGVFSFGDARFFGSMGGTPLQQPVVGIAAAPSGDGYWLVASDGGVFSFGPGAPFRGSLGRVPLQRPIVGVAAAPSGGYWLAGADGGVFSFGGAPFLGSLGSRPQAVVDIAGL